MHEARAAQLQSELNEARAQNAQLEDLLQLERENTVAAYEFTKPPVNIDTGQRIQAGGAVTLPADNSPVALAVAIGAAVVGFVVTLWLLLRK